MSSTKDNPSNQKRASPGASSATIQVNQTGICVSPKNECQNEGMSKAQSIVNMSQILQEDLQSIGLKIKQHEDNIKSMKAHKKKLDDSILDMRAVGKYRSSSACMTEGQNLPRQQTEEETTKQIIWHEKSAAGIYCLLKTRHGTQASNLHLAKDVLGVVSSLGKVDDDNLSRLFSEYLGLENMLAIVCKNSEGVRALETYDKEGCVNRSSGLHGLGASLGRALEGRFLVICLENLRPFVGDLVPDDPQRRLDLIKPRLPNGEHPPGFLGFAVNMIDIDIKNLWSLTASGYGLRETLFYTLFSRLQVYKTRADMLRALPCISDGALSLDGGMIKSTGTFSLGHREDVAVRFAQTFGSSGPPKEYLETEKRFEDMCFQRGKLLLDIDSEKKLLEYVKAKFDVKKQEFLKFLAESSSYATQVTTSR